jgi:hypothetical protein
MPTADLALINAEQRAFDWLKAQIADIDGGISGYVGEFPITLSASGFAVNERQMWMFAITTQNETMMSNVGNPVHCHLVMCNFRAMVEKRSTALMIAGRLRTILPAQPAALVQRLAIQPGLTIGRDTVELANDQDIGGTHRVWVIDQPLLMQFSNDDEQIGYEGD